MRCLVCDGQMVRKQHWLYACANCGFCSSNLPPGGGRGIEGLEVLRRRNFASLCEWLGNHFSLPGKKVLEIGCAEGWFLEEARQRGMVACAIEPSPPHAEISRAKGFVVMDGFFPDDMTAPGAFDFIIFNDVFEHLPNPEAAIGRCEELLNSGGILVLNLPSNRGFIYRLASLLARVGQTHALERLWQKGFPSPHLSYFNPETLQRFVDRYSRLRHVGTFCLDTLVADGLWERIQASHPGIAGRFVYASLRLVLPVFRLLPKDIVVGVFEKQSHH